METSRHLGLVLATVAILLSANLSCEEDVQGPQRQSKPSSRSSVWITLRGTVTSYDTGEPVENVKVSAYRIHSADRADTAMVTVLTDQYGKYVLTFSNRCDGSWYGLRMRKAGSPIFIQRLPPKESGRCRTIYAQARTGQSTSRWWGWYRRGS